MIVTLSDDDTGTYARHAANAVQLRLDAGEPPIEDPFSTEPSGGEDTDRKAFVYVLMLE